LKGVMYLSTKLQEKKKLRKRRMEKDFGGEKKCWEADIIPNNILISSIARIQTEEK